MQNEKNVRLTQLKDSIKNYKGYKVCSPEETIEAVSRGLERFTSKPVTYREENIGQSFLPNIGIATGKIEFDDKSLASGGKGCNSIWCKASAYAEFAERNSTRSHRGIKNVIENYKEIKSSRDSLFETKDRIESKVPDSYFFERGFLTTELNGLKNVINTTPQVWKSALSLTTGKNVHYPWLWHCISDYTNGIASGNTHEEALVHGICEVVERHARFAMLSGRYNYQEIDINTIPKPYKDWIRMLNEIGMHVRVLDLSHFGVPVMGVIFTDESFPNDLLFLRKWHKNVLMVGSNPDPRIALERCFTEFYQCYMPPVILIREVMNYDSLLRIWGYDDRINFPFHTNTNRMNRIPVSVIQGVKSFDAVAGVSDVNHLTELNRIVAGMTKHGVDVLAEDCTDPLIQFPVVRIVIPQACFSFIESPHIILSQIKAIDELSSGNYGFHEQLDSPNYSIYYGQSTFLSSILSGQWRGDKQKVNSLIHALEMKIKYFLIMRQNASVPTKDISSGIGLLRDLYIENDQIEHAMMLNDCLLSTNYTDIESLTKRYYIQDKMHMKNEAKKTINLIKRIDVTRQSDRILKDLESNNFVEPERFWDLSNVHYGHA